GAGGAIQTNINIPYIAGTATSTISLGGNVSITAPVTLSLTGVFWIAVAVAVLGIVARIYHRRFAPPEKIVKPEKAVKPEKIKLEKPKK
ncbi:MAG: hypothetical protein QMD95_04660, partial [Candidatus Hodarchaeaceae archaeon]|nr:hypothetical protein [Candidatus Hodarchaeaceae archaeon]